MASYPTLHEIRTAADDYWQIWQELLAAAPKLRHAVGQHSPVTLGWKVEGDLAPLEAAGRVYELGDSLYGGPVERERAIVTLRKPRAFALDTLQYIKFLQRRPSRPADRLGPDSLDFITPHGAPTAAVVAEACQGLGAHCEDQRNPSHSWLSVVYRDHEFKFATDSVWDVCVRSATNLL